MGLDYSWQLGQTALEEEEKEGLLLRTISTVARLNEAEQLNIQKTVEWTLRRKFKLQDIFQEAFVRDLHRRMFRNVWQWAGEFRKTNKNIGVDKFGIGKRYLNALREADKQNIEPLILFARS